MQPTETKKQNQQMHYSSTQNKKHPTETAQNLKLQIPEKSLKKLTTNTIMPQTPCQDAEIS